MGLEDKSDLAVPHFGQPAFVQLGQILVPEKYPAPRRAIQCANNIKQCAFPGA
jgi:hypothetical protein